VGLDRNDVPEHTDVIALPFYGGERTPYLPHAIASIVGMRSTTTVNELLLAPYHGVAAMTLRDLDAGPR
jgi:sugar (pentulose or hexulose) kinase